MPQEQAATGGLRPWHALLLLAALPAFLVNLLGVSDNRLWYDELQSVTHATRPFALVWPSAWIHDPHPPLYYQLLKLWTLFGTSDLWLLLSSSLLVALAGWALFRLAERHFGRNVAIAALILFAVNPLALFWSMYLRMYGMIMLLTVIMLDASLRFLKDEEQRTPALITIAASGLALTYAHILGAFFVLTLAIPVFLAIVRAGLPWRGWFLAHAAIGTLALPVVLDASGVELGHTRVPELPVIGASIAMQVTGPYSDAAPALLGLAAVLVLACMVLGLASRHTPTLVVAAIPIVALALGFLVTWLGRPIWIAPRLFAYLAPLFALLCAALLVGNAGRHAGLGFLRRAVAALAVLGTLAGSADLIQRHHKWDDFRALAQMVRTEGDPSDAIVTSTMREAWGVRWYLAGPAWQDEADREVSLKTWLKAVSELSFDRLRNRLNAHDRRPEFTAPPVFIAGKKLPAASFRHPRIWAVAVRGARLEPLIATLEQQGYELQRRIDERPVVAEMIRRPALARSPAP